MTENRDDQKDSDVFKLEINVMNEFKRCKWTGVRLTRILSFARDINVDEKLMETVANKFCEGIIESQATDIPSSCYNFLLFSAKLPPSCPIILRAFVHSCERLTFHARGLCPVARTSILHALYTVRRIAGVFFRSGLILDLMTGYSVIQFFCQAGSSTHHCSIETS